MMLRPFTLRVATVRTTWSGKVKRVILHEQSFRYPEEMIAEYSKWDGKGYSLWTFEPEFWDDDRPPREDLSFDIQETDRDLPF